MNSTVPTDSLGDLNEHRRAPDGTPNGPPRDCPGNGPCGHHYNRGSRHRHKPLVTKFASRRRDFPGGLVAVNRCNKTIHLDLSFWWISNHFETYDLDINYK